MAELLRKMLDEKFGDLTDEFEVLQKQFKALDHKFDHMQKRFGNLESNVQMFSGRLGVEARKIEKRVVRVIDEHFSKLHAVLRDRSEN